MTTADTAGLRTVELSAGPLQYRDVGSGPVLVLLHGLLMDETLWDGVVDRLATDHRCIVPVLPLGAHRLPVRSGTDLALPAVAGLAGELVERLDLHDVTLAGVDTGGALVQLLMADGADRVARVVLASCEAFDNLPPGLTGRTLVRTGRLPAALFGLAMAPMRLRSARRTLFAFGRLTRRGDAATARWVRTVLADPAVRRDAVRVLRAIAADAGLLERVAPRLAGFTRPALVVWAAGDRVMPPEHGRRLAALLPRARYVEVADSDTLLPLDQPAELARLVREFVREPA